MTHGGHDGDPGLRPRPDPGAAKGAWRNWARVERRAWARAPGRPDDEAAIAAHLAAWAPWRAARTVLVYQPFGSEAAPPLVLGGRTVLTTRTDAEGRLLTLHAVDGPLELHPLGFAQPAADAAPVDPACVDLALVPGLAFDLRGGRLGYGRGLYDALLPRLPSGTPRVGVTVDALVVPALPSEAHDVPMTYLATPTGLRPVG